MNMHTKKLKRCKYIPVHGILYSTILQYYSSKYFSTQYTASTVLRTVLAAPILFHVASSMRVVLGFLLGAAVAFEGLAHHDDDDDDVIIVGASSEQFDTFRGDGSDDHAAQRLRTRIFGGQPASDGAYPSYAIPRLSIFGGKLCGSVQIWHDILLSAGHCSGAFRGNEVWIGTNHLDGSTALETIRAVSELIHPQWNRARFVNDFMLVKLQRASTAPNMPWNADPLVPLNGESVQIIGFGTTERGIISNTLLEASVDIVDYETCRQAYGSWLRNDIMMCASRLNTDTCTGDRYVL